MAPVVEAGERSRDGAETAHRECVVRRLLADAIERERGRPRAEWDVRQRRVERVPEPRAVEQVANRLRDGVDRLLQRLGDGVERLCEVGELLREPEVRHALLVPGAPRIETTPVDVAL